LSGRIVGELLIGVGKWIKDVLWVLLRIELLLNLVRLVLPIDPKRIKPGVGWLIDLSDVRIIVKGAW
jgi:hypothetical protein